MTNRTSGYKQDPVAPPAFNTRLPPELQHELRIFSAEIDRPLYAVAGAALDIGLRYIKAKSKSPEYKQELLKFINRFLTKSGAAAVESEPEEEPEDLDAGLDPELAEIILDAMARSAQRKRPPPSSPWPPLPNAMPVRGKPAPSGKDNHHLQTPQPPWRPPPMYDEGEINRGRTTSGQ
jgi:hypothetical protein